MMISFLSIKQLEPSLYQMETFLKVLLLINNLKDKGFLKNLTEIHMKADLRMVLFMGEENSQLKVTTL